MRTAEARQAQWVLDKLGLASVPPSILLAKDEPCSLLGHWEPRITGSEAWQSLQKWGKAGVSQVCGEKRFGPVAAFISCFFLQQCSRAKVTAIVAILQLAPSTWSAEWSPGEVNWQMGKGGGLFSLPPLQGCCSRPPFLLFLQLGCPWKQLGLFLIPSDVGWAEEWGAHPSRVLSKMNL